MKGLHLSLPVDTLKPDDPYHELFTTIANRLETISNHFQAQAGTAGPVGIAKQRGKDKNKNTEPAIILEGDRVTGVADPINDTDAVPYGFLKKLLRCENLRRILALCTDINEIGTGTSATTGTACVPARLALTNTLDTGIAPTNQINQVVARGDYLYLHAPGTPGVNGFFKIYYIGDPVAGIQLVGSLTLTSGILSNTAYLAIQDSFAYLWSTNGKLVVVNIARPDNPFLESFTTFGSGVSSGIAVAGKYAYAGEDDGANQNLVVIDISDPVNPELMSLTLIVASRPGLGGIVAFGDLCLITERKSFGGKLHIFNIADPTAPVSLSSTSLTSNAGDWVSFDGRYAFVVGDSDNAGNSLLTIIDCLNPASPTIVSTLSFPMTICSSGCDLEGNSLYATGVGITQLIQFDVSNKAAPKIAAEGVPGNEITADGAVPSVQARYVYTARNLDSGSNFRIEAYNVGGFYCEAVETGGLQVSRGGKIYADWVGGKHGQFGVLSATLVDADLGFSVFNLPVDPTTSDIPPGQWRVWKNTSTGAVKLWVNDAGTLKSVAIV